MPRPVFEPGQGAIRVALSATSAHRSPLFQSIALRQCTHCAYYGKPLLSADLALLQNADSAPGFQPFLLTDLPTMAHVLDHMLAANTVQMTDPAFVRELKNWIGLNATAAVRFRRGPSMPLPARLAGRAR